jgi:hypothetical protein
MDTLLSSLAKCFPSFPFLSFPSLPSFLPSFLIFYSLPPFVLMMMSSKAKVPPFCGYKLVVGRGKGWGGGMGCSHFVKISNILLFIRLHRVHHQYINTMNEWPFTLDEKFLASNWVWTLDLYIFAHNKYALSPSLHPTTHNNLIIIIIIVVVIIIIIIIRISKIKLKWLLLIGPRWWLFWIISLNLYIYIYYTHFHGYSSWGKQLNTLCWMWLTNCRGPPPPIVGVLVRLALKNKIMVG